MNHNDMKKLLYTNVLKTRSAVAVALLLAFALAPAAVLGQNSPTPGPEHQALKKMEGTWSAKVKMGDEESAGTQTSKLELGGLWLVSQFKGEFGGEKFEGRGMDGYDPGKGKYVSVWVDSMSTKPMLLEGTYDKEKKTLTMIGEAPGPGGEMAKHKLVTHMPDDDHHKLTMYIIGADGEEIQIMTIDYTRKK
jgi:hypothetical protein